MKKKLLIISSVIIIIILGVGYYLFTNLDSIAKSIIESVGTKASGTKVTVGSVKLAITEGKATIYNLRFANPKGFSDNSMIDCGEITAQVDYKTGAISKIHIGSPHFLFEQKGINNNFAILQKSSKKQADEKPVEEAKPEAKSKDKTPPKVYQIDSFSIDDARVDFTSLDTKDSGEVTVSKIRFSKLKGTPEQIMEQVITQLTTQIIYEVSKKIAVKQLEGSIKGPAGKAIGNALKNLF